MFFVWSAGNQDAIFFFVSVTRMSQAVSQLAIVGEQNQPFAIDIQAANRVELAWQFHQVAHRWPGIGGADCREVAARFVQGNVDELLGRLDRLSIDQDAIHERVSLLAQNCWFAIDSHPTCGDVRLAGPARAKAGVRENFL